MPIRLINLILFHVGWLACVYGGARGAGWAALLIVAVVAAVHLLTCPRPDREWRVLAWVGLLGTAVDSIQMHAGVLHFAHDGGGLLIPAWFAAMWVNFATMPNMALAWLHGRPVLATVFGGLGGPLAYYGGVKIGAITWGTSAPIGLLAVAVAWGVAMPLIMLIARAVQEDAADPSTEPPHANLAGTEVEPS